MNESASINAFALDVHRAVAVAGNLAISGLSIQSCMAMLDAGAAGRTHDEIVHACRLGEGASRAIAELGRALGSQTSYDARLANRVFVRQGVHLRDAFARDVARERLDFSDAEAARAIVNEWVARQTNGKITGLVPRGAIDPTAPLLLVNALYVRADWLERLHVKGPGDFHVGGARVPVTMMQGGVSCRSIEADDFELVGLSLRGELQLVAVVPRDPGGLAAVERALDAELLARAAHAPRVEIVLDMPKFRVELPGASLVAALGALGVAEAFDASRANFEGIAELAPGDAPIYVGEVLHKTYCDVNEYGIEAAAATAVMAMGAAAPRPPKKRVRIDCPFFFAIQHVPSGATLFTGRVTDPRA